MKYSIFYFPRDNSRCGINSPYVIAMSEKDIAVSIVEDLMDFSDMHELQRCDLKETLGKIDFYVSEKNKGLNFGSYPIKRLLNCDLNIEDDSGEITKKAYKKSKFKKFDTVDAGMGNWGIYLGKFEIKIDKNEN